MKPIILPVTGALLALAGCATPAATTKDQDPGSVELSRSADGVCTIRTPGLTPRNIDASCLDGSVHSKPDQQYGANWLQYGLAGLGAIKLFFP